MKTLESFQEYLVRALCPEREDLGSHKSELGNIRVDEEEQFENGQFEEVMNDGNYGQEVS